ncbi:hypothetical protein K488DRAFT_88828 [Vararia minispora EC-137]|uniref:Uncharacterized protein n=1 Tax=Vararia minispora EC-137 TaxID=1314806 RepID=A0ACB8QC83_9AGAM|nr:hypothetical protein K488DRAFT_88828 [Vararia minispora EC-137]
MSFHYYHSNQGVAPQPAPTVYAPATSQHLPPQAIASAVPPHLAHHHRARVPSTPAIPDSYPAPPIRQSPVAYSGGQAVARKAQSSVDLRVRRWLDDVERQHDHPERHAMRAGAAVAIQEPCRSDARSHAFQEARAKNGPGTPHPNKRTNLSLRENPPVVGHDRDGALLPPPVQPVVMTATIEIPDARANPSAARTRSRRSSSRAKPHNLRAVCSEMYLSVPTQGPCQAPSHGSPLPLSDPIPLPAWPKVARMKIEFSHSIVGETKLGRSSAFRALGVPVDASRAALDNASDRPVGEWYNHRSMKLVFALPGYAHEEVTLEVAARQATREQIAAGMRQVVQRFFERVLTNDQAQMEEGIWKGAPFATNLRWSVNLRPHVGMIRVEEVVPMALLYRGSAVWEVAANHIPTVP